MEKCMVTCGNVFYKNTGDTKRPNSQLWMNISVHSYILTVQHLKWVSQKLLIHNLNIKNHIKLGSKTTSVYTVSLTLLLPCWGSSW